MNTNQFYLLIIIIILIIIISLFIQCNKKVLKNLEENATKDIIETYYHLGSAAPTEPGQKGYKISSISEGKYGGRSSQEVLNNIGSHTLGDYISIDEKDSYGSNLFNVTGDPLQSTNCDMSSPAILSCQNCYNGKLSYIYNNVTLPTYGGNSCGKDFIIDSNKGYKYILKDDVLFYNIPCDDNISNNNLTTINIIRNYSDDTYRIADTHNETNWCGFLNSNEIFSAIEGLTGISNGSKITVQQKDILESNKQNPIALSKYEYKKYAKGGFYYNIEYSYVLHNTYRYTGKQQQFIVPITGIYRVIAIGGRGKGNSAKIEGEIELEKDTVINIRVGGNGIGQTIYLNDGSYTTHYSGGGGTYIVKNKNNPRNRDIIVIAGGSGSCGPEYHDYGVCSHDAILEKEGGADWSGGSGGEGGYGDYGGGGFITDGSGKSYINGSAGGESSIVELDYTGNPVIIYNFDGYYMSEEYNYIDTSGGYGGGGAGSKYDNFYNGNFNKNIKGNGGGGGYNGGDGSIGENGTASGGTSYYDNLNEVSKEHYYNWNTGFASIKLIEITE